MLKDRFRKSTSNNNTFFPAKANVIAKLNDTKVLPDPGFADVNIITFALFSPPTIKSKLVRNILKASDTLSRPPSRTMTISPSALFLLNGISAKKGTVVLSSISLRPRTVVFNNIIKAITAAGITHPIARAANNIIIVFGDTGVSLPLAASITRALLSVIAIFNAFSSLLFNRYKYNSSFIFC